MIRGDHYSLLVNYLNNVSINNQIEQIDKYYNQIKKNIIIN